MVAGLRCLLSAPTLPLEGDPRCLLRGPTLRGEGAVRFGTDRVAVPRCDKIL